MLIALASAGEHGTYKAGSVSDFPVCLEREIVIALVGQRSKRGMAWFRQIKSNNRHWSEPFRFPTGLNCFHFAVPSTPTLRDTVQHLAHLNGVPSSQSRRINPPQHPR